MSKLTPEKRARFFSLLAEGMSVTHACQGIGVARQSVYALRSEDDDFKAGWDDALEAGTDMMEDEARERAKKSSDLLMIFLLKGRRPEKYRERVSTEITGKAGGPVEYAYGRFTSISSEDLEQIETFLLDQTDDDAAE